MVTDHVRSGIYYGLLELTTTVGVAVSPMSKLNRHTFMRYGPDWTLAASEFAI